MKHVFLCTALLSAILFSIGGACADDRKMAEELYSKSGLEEQVKDIGAAVLVGYRNNYRRSDKHSVRDEQINRQIERVIDDSFDPETLRDTVIVGQTTDLSAEDLEAALAWLDSPVGEKVTELEEKASSEEGVKGLQDFARNFNKSSVSAERVRLIRELDQALHITETALDITLSTQFALSMTTREGDETLTRDDIRDLFDDFQKYRPQLEPLVENRVHASLLYTYQQLTDKELGEYLAFAKSAKGAKYNRITALYLTRAITASCLDFAWEINQL